MRATFDTWVTMSETWLLPSALIVLLSLIHMATEAHTFGRASGAAGDPWSDPMAATGHDAIWLVSCLLFVAHTGVCAYAALALPALGPAGLVVTLAGALIAGGAAIVIVPRRRHARPSNPLPT